MAGNEEFVDNCFVAKAEAIGDQYIPDSAIVIEGSVPHYDDLENYDAFYKSEAARILLALRRLPGGTFDRLLGMMMEERASLFSISLFGKRGP